MSIPSGSESVSVSISAPSANIRVLVDGTCVFGTDCTQAQGTSTEHNFSLASDSTSHTITSSTLNSPLVIQASATADTVLTTSYVSGVSDCSPAGTVCNSCDQYQCPSGTS